MPLPKAKIFTALLRQKSLGWHWMEVTSEQRRNAKAINFGLIYGMSAFGLSRQLGIGRADAQSYMDLYFKRYPDVQTFMHDIREKAKAQAMWKPYSAVVYICRISTPLTVCAVKLPSV